MARLEIKDVSVRFGGVQALTAVDLEVLPGRVTGLIGPNGAGKTTLFNVITGLQAPNSGRVVLDGRDIANLAPHRRARLGLARTFQRLELFGTLSARENVQMAFETRRAHSAGVAAVAGAGPGADVGAAAAKGSRFGRGSGHSATVAGELLSRVGVAHVADEPADMLPTGLARLVELARALATSPSVLLLDEPSAGLDDSETDELGAVLESLASAGMGVLLVEHDMGLVMSVCAHVAVLDSGSIIAEGEPDAIQRDPLVQSAYLGTEGHVEGPPVGRRADGRVGVDGSSASGQPLTEQVAQEMPQQVAPQAPLTAIGVTPGDGKASSTPVLELRDVRAGYGRIEVVHGVSLTVRKGSVLALLGPNGAGKSTLMKVASGQLQPMSGTVLVDQIEVTSFSGQRMVRRGLCAVPEGRPVFPNLTVAENLRMYTYCRKDLRIEDVEEQSYARFPVLRDRRRQLAGKLSGGEQQALALARALCSGARVLLLDEISMGLAPIIVSQLYERVARLVEEEGVAVVLVEQFAKMALGLAQEAAILVNGQIVRSGSPAEIEPELVRSYMGESGVAG
ncbi:MAG: ATP-binding cassette domain-containing protein [Acidimicrobiales bacterium]